MPITISFENPGYSIFLDWLRRLDEHSYVYIWPTMEVTFFNEEDAIAFMFAFDGRRKITKIEQMIKYAIDE